MGYLAGRAVRLLTATVCLAGLNAASAVHAQIGTPVADRELATLGGGKGRVLGDVGASVLVFFRPGQERSKSALEELTGCQAKLAGKSVRWAAVVSDAAPADGVAALMRETRFAAPVLVDSGDALYGSLGIALHPVVVIVGADRRLAAFEPFRSLDFCTVVSARIRHTLREISDDELRAALEPPSAAMQGGADQVARRYHALAAMQFKAGNHDKALDSVRKSLERNPQFAPSHELMGEILLAQMNCVAAVDAFTQALALDANSAAAKAGIERCKAGR
ncbi:MAG: hypothetical protein Q8K96_13820 [Rubrivivax sp.]|nr:hypothetical protein [Rubrivivax sp.]